MMLRGVHKPHIYARERERDETHHWIQIYRKWTLLISNLYLCYFSLFFVSRSSVGLCRTRAFILRMNLTQMWRGIAHSIFLLNLFFSFIWRSTYCDIFEMHSLLRSFSFQHHVELPMCVCVYNVTIWQYHRTTVRTTYIKKIVCPYKPNGERSSFHFPRKRKRSGCVSVW